MTENNLGERLARLEERMETVKAELKGTLNEFRADMAGFRTDMAKRDKDNLRWIVGAIVAAVIVIIGALRYLVG